MNATEEIHPKEEREKMLRLMRQASNAFYFAAQRIGCHPFIEFTGFINEWIKIAERAHGQDVDFTAANTHTGQALPMEVYEAEYVAEKFDCIFGPTLRQDPKLLEAFIHFLRTGEKQSPSGAV